MRLSVIEKNFLFLYLLAVQSDFCPCYYLRFVYIELGPWGREAGVLMEQRGRVGFDFMIDDFSMFSVYYIPFTFC